MGIGINLGNLFDCYDISKEIKTPNDQLTLLGNSIPKKDSNIYQVIVIYLIRLIKITNDDEFWKTIYNLLIQNYDVVFFDTGIDYMGKTPISDLYKVADKIIITCNTSINSVKSIIKQILTLSGKRPNNVFDASDDIISRINIVLTRVSDEYEDVNELVVNRLSRYAPIIAAFGNIDGLIYRIQWGGTWNLIDEQDDILDNLRRITDLSGDA